MELHDVLFLVLCLCSSVVSAVFGFGTALLVLAVGPYILPVTETIVLATVLFTASTITKTIIFSRSIDYKLVLKISVISFPFAYLGASLLAVIPVAILQQMLGLMILIYLFLTTVVVSPGIGLGAKALVVGAASYGLVSGLLGSGNLIKVILFKELEITKQAFVGTMAATAILANIAKITAYIQTDVFNEDLTFLVLGLILISVVSAFIGKALLVKLSLSHFEIGLKLILAMSAIGLLF